MKELMTLYKSFKKSFLASIVFKFALLLLRNKFKISFVLNNHKEDILRFGVVCGLFSISYRIVRLILKKLGFQLGKDLEIFIACLISGSTLLLHNRNDINLIKTITYPRAFEALYNILIEKNIIKQT